MFTFLHAADIHLDSPLLRLPEYEGAQVEKIRRATRDALENLVDLAIEKSVDFVVLSGDLYDGDWRHFGTGQFFVGQMGRLREAGIPVFGVHGNHDAASKITHHLPLPENVYFFATSAAETQRVDGLDVAIHGQSFAHQCTTEDLAKDYPAAVQNCFNLGVLHTSMTGREGHDSYAPCSETCLRGSGYDYWALGHIHHREVLAGNRPTIAYPGNTQGRKITEKGAKGCLLVHVDDTYEVTTEFQALDVVRWEVANVSLDGAESQSEALHRVEEVFRSLVENAEGRLIATRVIFEGRTPLASDLAADPMLWTANVQSIALNIGRESLYVEKVKSEAVDPDESHAEASEDTPVSEVISIVDKLSNDSSLAEELNLDFEALYSKLPVDVKRVVNIADADCWKGLLHEAKAKLLKTLRE